MIPLFSTDGTSTRPLGMAMCQNRLAVPTWSYAMEVYPPARIVEVGTYSGGLTIALGVHAYNLEPRAQITSYERSRAPDERYAALGKFLGITFRDQVDVWDCEREIAEIIKRPGVTYVLCDGGDKARELATFAKYLKSGDVIAGHDYSAANLPAENHPWPWRELHAEHAAPVAAEHDLEPWMQEHFDFAGWLVHRKRGA
jgi:hypothetical protein